MSKYIPCPVCGMGHLTRHTKVEKITFKDASKDYQHFYSVCDVCHVEQTNAEEMKLNKRSVVKAKKLIEGLLTGEEVLEIRKKLGIKQDEAALIFGGGPKAFSKYEKNDVSQSESMDKLLRLAARSHIHFYALRKISSGDFSEPREFSRVSISFGASFAPARRDEPVYKTLSSNKQPHARVMHHEE